MRKLIAAGFTSLIISSFIYSVAESVWLFYLGGVFLGLGISWTTTTMVGSLVNTWCKKNRGTLNGIILSANGFGAALAVQILSPIINKAGNAFAYQNAYRLVCLILVVVGVIVVSIVRDKPKVAEEEGESVASGKKTKGGSWVGITFSDACRTKYFYVTVASIFLIGMVLQGITGVATPHFYDVGLSAEFVAWALSFNSIVLTFSKFSAGLIYDRFGIRASTSISLVSSLVVMLLLILVTDSPAGKIMTLLYGIFAAIALPLETVFIPIFANEFFGEKNYNKILGIFASASTAGFAVGTPLTNLCYDVTGNYTVAFYIAIGIIVLIMLAMQYIINSANKQKLLVTKNADDIIIK